MATEARNMRDGSKLGEIYLHPSPCLNTQRFKEGNIREIENTRNLWPLQGNISSSLDRFWALRAGFWVMMHMVFDDQKVFDYPQVCVDLKVILDENINCDGPKEFDDPK